MEKQSNFNITMFRVGFLLLITLAFLRPLLTVFTEVAGIPLNIGVTLLISYLLLFFSLCMIKNILDNFDSLELIIGIFSLYIIFSVAWGSDLGNVARMILPFITFYAARLFLDSPKKVRYVLIALILGYVLPIVGSFILMFSDSSVKMIEYYSKVERQAGLYNGIHTCAHSMGFFSILFAFYFAQKRGTSAFSKSILFILLVLSIYNLYYTYTRSAFLGFLIFWASYFFLWRKRYLIYSILVTLPIIVWKISSLFIIFFKTSEADINAGSSGRIEIWTHNINLFFDFPFYVQLIGNGLGSESKTVIGGPKDIWSSHNDWISLLMTIGVVGLLLYGYIFIKLLVDIIRSNLDIQIKAIYISFITMVIFISFFTNGYVGRFEMIQMFWLIMGCSYCLIKE